MKTIITLDNNKNVLYYKDSNISWSKTYKDNILIQYNDSVGNYWDISMGIINPYDILCEIHIIPIWNIIKHLITIEYNKKHPITIEDNKKHCDTIKGLTYINHLIKLFKLNEDMIIDAYMFRINSNGIGVSRNQPIINGIRTLKYFSEIIYFRI
jgi:hypothetical protein